MNKKHLNTYKKIFDTPVRSDVQWKDIEKMFKALGAILIEKDGSRIGIKLKNTKALFHRPHPKKETDKGALKSVRKFLNNARIKEKDLC
jgi:hypothetical protein